MSRTARKGTIQVDRHGNPFGPSHYFIQTCPSCEAKYGRALAQSMGGDPDATRCTACGATTPKPVPRVMRAERGWEEWQATLPLAMRHPDYVALMETGEVPALAFVGPWPQGATWGDLRHYELILGTV